MVVCLCVYVWCNPSLYLYLSVLFLLPPQLQAAVVFFDTAADSQADLKKITVCCSLFIITQASAVNDDVSFLPFIHISISRSAGHLTSLSSNELTVDQFH